MWTSGSGLPGLGVFIFIGALLGAAFMGLVWAFVVYVWPWLKAIIHAVTA